MKTESVHRFEYKYFLSYTDYVILKHRIGAVLPQDTHGDAEGKYTVRSLYFDTLENDAYFDKIDGISKRAKIRIRMYNGDIRSLKLEVKKKQGDVVRKISTHIQEKDVYSLIETGMPLSETIPADIVYVLERNVYKPAVVVEYIREAFYLPIQDIRITFDSYVQKKEYTTEFLDSNMILERAEEIPWIILEVKFNNTLPQYISRLLTFHSHHRVAISKYCYSREVIY